MNNILAPDYSEISDELLSIKLDIQPAQIHGLFCGYLCAAPRKKADLLIKKIMGESKNHQCYNCLKKLYEYTSQQLNDFSFEFTLLLPEDDIDINSRTEALGLWCQEFLTSLKQSGIPIEHRSPSDVTDTLNDLLEIAQVNYGDITDNEEDETAYFELVEYVRLAVIMIFQEINSDVPPKK